MLKTCLEEGEVCHVNGLSDFLKVLCVGEFSQEWTGFFTGVPVTFLYQ